MIKLVPYAKVRVNYKSGISMVLHCTQFNLDINGGNRRLEWNTVGGNRPLFLNVDEIESVYQIGRGIKLAWVEKE